MIYIYINQNLLIYIIKIVSKIIIYYKNTFYYFRKIQIMDQYL